MQKLELAQNWEQLVMQELEEVQKREQELTQKLELAQNWEQLVRLERVQEQEQAQKKELEQQLKLKPAQEKLKYSD
jgi:hypothetical protein